MFSNLNVYGVTRLWSVFEGELIFMHALRVFYYFILRCKSVFFVISHVKIKKFSPPLSLLQYINMKKYQHPFFPTSRDNPVHIPCHLYVCMCAHFSIYQGVSTLLSLLECSKSFIVSQSTVLETLTCTYAHKHCSFLSFFLRDIVTSR